MTKLVDNPASAGRIVLEEQGAIRLFGLRLLGALGLGMVFLTSFVMKPSSLGPGFCVFRNAFGIPCPGCGLTRSFIAMSQGRLAVSFSMHPLGPFIYVSFALYMAKWALEAGLRRRVFAKIEDRLRLPVLWAFLAVMIVVWVIRLAMGLAE